MPEAVKIESAANPTWPEWFVVEAAAAAGSERLAQISSRSSESDTYFVSLIVNGIEVPFLAAVKRFEEQIESMIREAAEDEIGKHIGDVLNKLTEMGDEANELTRQLRVRIEAPPLVKLTGDRPAR